MQKSARALDVGQAFAGTGRGRREEGPARSDERGARQLGLALVFPGQRVRHAGDRKGTQDYSGGHDAAEQKELCRPDHGSSA